MSNKVTDCYQVLFVSTFTPGTEFKAVADIARHARWANQAAGITGLLVFDGIRFCELMEGVKTQVLSIIDRIQVDSRHSQMKILHQGPMPERHFAHFSLGYPILDQSSAIKTLSTLSGEAAVTAFLELVPTLDLES